MCDKLHPFRFMSNLLTGLVAQSHNWLPHNQVGHATYCRFSSRAARSCLAMSFASTLEVGVVEGLREIWEVDFVGVGGAFSTVLTESVEKQVTQFSPTWDTRMPGMPGPPGDTVVLWGNRTIAQCPTHNNNRTTVPLSDV